MIDVQTVIIDDVCERMKRLPAQHPSRLFPEGDHDEIHRIADQLLLEGLTALGGQRLVDAYLVLRKQVEFWYA